MAGSPTHRSSSAAWYSSRLGASSRPSSRRSQAGVGVAVFSNGRARVGTADVLSDVVAEGVEGAGAFMVLS